MSKKLLAALRLAFAGALIYAAFAPGPDAPQILPWDKAAHFAAFFTLATLAALSFPRAPLLVIGVALSGLGAAIELIQALPAVGRDGDVVDWLVDTAAIGLALWPSSICLARARLRQPKINEKQTN
jgi:VanZ family protein